MKNSFLTLVFTCFALIAFSQKADIASLKQAELNRFNVMVAKDRAALEAVLHKDLVYFHSGGNSDTKDSYIASIFSGKSSYVSIVPVEIQTRVYGKTGINTGVLNLVNLSADGKETPVFENGRWQMVSWQSTKLVN
jgi:hypothetical protein